MELSDKLEMLNDLLVDFRAQSIIAFIAQRRGDWSNILVNNLGDLKRGWSKEIEKCGVERYFDGQETLWLDLNKPGIYDALPEAIFHSFSDHSPDSGERMATDSRLQKIREKEARLFFAPIESELFYLLVELSFEEFQIHNEILSDFINGITNNFWQTDKCVPKKYQSRFNKVLPYAKDIVGDINLTQASLSYVLEEDVELCLYEEGKRKEKTLNSGFALGEKELGYDTSIANHDSNYYGSLHVNIGPLKNTPVEDFICTGNAHKTVNSFIDYIIPIELDTRINVLTSNDKTCLGESLDLNVESACLGLNTVLE